MIRCHGRQQYTEILPFDVPFPIILPPGHWVTKRNVTDHHEFGYQAAGSNHTLGNSPACYWTVSARDEIRELENQCNECKKRKGKTAFLTFPLPKVRR